jgi:uncharacterized protein YacL
MTSLSSLSGVSDFRDESDLLYIFGGILVFELFTLIYARFGGLNSKSLSKWYQKFHLNAVLSDVLSIFIGFLVARWLVTYQLPNKYKNNILVFVIVLLLVQILHDIFFYYCCILPIPSGHNEMIDVFKEYAKEHSAKIIGADSILMLGSLMFALILKNYSGLHTIEIMAFCLYSIIYLIYTK